jgi:hypothetical protein
MTGDGNGRQLSLPPTVLNYLQSVVGDVAVTSLTIWEAKSAQQQVFIVSLDASQCHQNVPSAIWRNALEQGCHHVVVRLWIGSARWWNLHCSEFNDKDDDDGHDGVLTLARAEVAGYRIARTALLTTKTALVEIPRVLHFSHDHSQTCKSQQQPWAIMSYVGPKSAFFNDSQHKPTDEWLDGMVTIRHEFGFDEPHPRWGRVPVDQCLTYCFHILERFILPMHGYFLSNEGSSALLDWTDLGTQSSSSSSAAKGNVKPRTYKDMIALYERAHSKMIPKDDDDEQQTKIIHVLGQCIQRLAIIGNKEQAQKIEDMPPVLCHMDCQPQNLIFFRQGGGDDDNPLLFQLHSVLDWEEAAYADPRFELLLLCRKVCANRHQAQAVWDYYSREIQHINPTLVVGAMDAWLQLETVHSITTLVLQSMDLLVGGGGGGGRNPWETKPDLLGKMEREFHRLKDQGWTFCEDAITR